jgi:hypothetical protein
VSQFSKLTKKLIMLPAPIYNIMPFFYLGSGFSIPLALDNVFAFLSGVSLAAAACLIMRARMWI